MKQLGEGVFEVPSDSDYSRTYVVNLTGEYAQCTCTAWAIKRNKNKSRGLPPGDCKHVTAVKRMNPDALQAQRAAEAKARADADAAKAAAEQEKRQKMALELAKMRRELDGTPEPEPRETITETAVRLGLDTALPAAKAIDEQVRIAKKDPEPKDDLLAQLEAKIQARKK
jgi:hypothetical protein